MSEITDKSKDWTLQSIELKLIEYGDDKGKYKGKIYFRNGEYESLNLNISKEDTQKFIDLIAEQVIKSSNDMAERIKQIFCDGKEEM